MKWTSLESRDMMRAKDRLEHVYSDVSMRLSVEVATSTQTEVLWVPWF
jgi:hypothetical protein